MERTHPRAKTSQKWLLTTLCAAAMVSMPVTSHAQAVAIESSASAEFVNAAESAPPCSGQVLDRATMSRDRLVLNGAPSALERIRMNQRIEAGAAPEVSAPNTQSILMRSLANRPVASSMAPASRTALKLGEVKAQNAEPQCEQEQAQEFADAFRSDRSPTAELMGTRAILVGRTAFDARWQRVKASAPLGLMRSQLQQAGVVDGMAQDEVLTRVNRFVNRLVAYRADDANYGQRDYWASAAETIAKKSGDCEDYAILKMHMLRAAGVSASKMRLMLLRDLAGNADHAFLVVASSAGDKVLDNTIDRVYGAHEATAVRPVLSFSEDRRWVHAIRNQDLAANVVAARSVARN